MLSCRVFQQQFCQIGKPVNVRNIKPGFLWDPDTLQRATTDLKGMYTKASAKTGRRGTQAPKPLTVTSFSILLDPVFLFLDVCLLPVCWHSSKQ